MSNSFGSTRIRKYTSAVHRNFSGQGQLQQRSHRGSLKKPANLAFDLLFQAEIHSLIEVSFALSH
ncbi:hypothetical protein [Virgibacillus proomii]|uniref:hypothetical protein n=1 Tax=Virgibacillus proomii TaxID=84407 RepID=UPI001C10FA0F|nr:hypothetical protein [Virgibacillus proomii]MBU5266629.1 hypothetical protein [Virgibacillus proomii]